MRTCCSLCGMFPSLEYLVMATLPLRTEIQPEWPTIKTRVSALAAHTFASLHLVGATHALLGGLHNFIVTHDAMVLAYGCMELVFPMTY